MKKAKHLIEPIIDPGNLREAFWKARKGKSYSNAVIEYRKSLDQNLLLLRSEIKTGKVSVGDYRYFTIYEPKERKICASAFQEQVLHHALMNICHPYFEQKQIFDSYASRKGKGTYNALKRAKSYTRKYPFFLKLDIRKFFASISYNVLKHQLARMFKDEMLLNIFEKIINSYQDGRATGLPIGNLTSQYFANHYLSGLDHFIKEDLHCMAYVRYMDDMILWDDDKARLKKMYEEILCFVRMKLLLDMKPLILNKSTQGLPFLGYLIYPYHVRLLQKSKQRFIKKMKLIQDNYDTGYWSEAECQRKALPLIAFTEHAEAHEFRRKVLLKL